MSRSRSYKTLPEVPIIWDYDKSNVKERVANIGLKENEKVSTKETSMIDLILKDVPVVESQKKVESKNNLIKTFKHNNINN